MVKAHLIAAASLAALAFPAHAQTVGVTAAIRNTVTMKTARDAAYRPAKLKERVAIGDNIATSAASVLQILLLDRTSLTVGANARVKIDRFVYDPNRSASAVGASIAKGAFRFMSAKAMRGAPGQSSISTPVAAIGVRGTIFEGAVGADAVRIARGETAVGNVAANEETATLIVLRGPGNRAQGDEKPGAIDVAIGAQTVTLDRPGLALFVPGPGMAPIGPFAISDSGLALLHALLRTSPNSRRRANAVELDSNPIVDIIFECEGSGDIQFDPANPAISTSSGCGVVQ